MSKLAEIDIIKPVAFTCSECRREMARVVDVAAAAPDQARRVARALRTPPDLCFACAINPGWFLNLEDRSHASFDEAAHGR